MIISSLREERIQQRQRELRALESAGLLARDAYEGKTVIDWECGDAAFAIAFRRLGAKEVHAIDSWVDYDEGFASECKENGVFVKRQSLLQYLSAASAKFDLAFCNTVTEHVQNLPECVIAISNLLNSRGLFYTNHDNYYHPAGCHDHGFIQVKGNGELVNHSVDCWARAEKCEASAEHRRKLLRDRPYQWNAASEILLDPSHCDECPYFMRAQPWGHIIYQSVFATVFPKNMKTGKSLNKITPFQLRQILVENGFQIMMERHSHIKMAPPASALAVDSTLSEQLLRTWMVKILARRSLD